MSNVVLFPNQINPVRFFEKAGWVYVISNESMPGIVKIGRAGCLAVRMRQLFNTSIPTPFVCVFAEWFADSFAAEKFIHARLEAQGMRVKSTREFFTDDVAVIQNAFMTYSAIGESIPDSMVDLYAYRRRQKEHNTMINGTLVARASRQPISTEVPS